jgi:hypothetical protein
MDEKRILKITLKKDIIREEPVGKPKERWVNIVEIENREVLKVRNWKRESLDRQVWRRHLKETKVRLRAVAPKKSKKKKKNKKKSIENMEIIIDATREIDLENTEKLGIC